MLINGIPRRLNCIKHLDLELDAEHDHEDFEENEGFISSLEMLIHLFTQFENVMRLSIRIWCQNEIQLSTISSFLLQMPSVLPKVAHLAVSDSVHAVQVGLRPILFHFITNSWKLKSLNLENTYLELNYHDLIDILRKQKLLERFNAPECFFGTTDALLLALSASQMTRLREIEIRSRDILSGVDYGVVTASATANLSKNCPCIETIVLNGFARFSIYSPDALYFFSGFSRCRRLKHLELSVDHMDFTFPIFKFPPFEFPMLQVFDLSNCESCSVELLEYLSMLKWPMLKELLLPEKCQSPVAISNFLNNSRLRRLGLGLCFIRTGGDVFTAITMCRRVSLQRIEVLETEIDAKKPSSIECIKLIMLQCPNAGLYVKIVC